MARPMGAVRLRKGNAICLVLGTGLIIFILVFLFGSPSAVTTIPIAGASIHHLSPPTFPYLKKPSGAKSTKPPPVVRYNLNDVTVTSDPMGNRESILILTPLARFYPEYWENLLKLTYPHDLITIGFIIPKNKEGNQATAELQKAITKTQKQDPVQDRFKSIIILRQDFDPVILSQNEAVRHKLENQKARRASMARARNSLLFTTLGPTTSWVLWMDADIVETPPTLIQDLAAHDKPILTPNCFQRFTNDKGQPDERGYDYNNWQDSETAQKLGDTLGADDILLEGYAELPTYRTLMVYMTAESQDVQWEVPLDGVGGCALMVKAQVHRDGAMFPPFVFYHLIETEGFAKMAKRLGWQSYGLPNYRVRSFEPSRGRSSGEC